MNKFAQFLSIALISATSVAGVNAQNIKPQLAGAPGTNTAAAILGSPVTCTAKGYWQGSISLILKKLDAVRGTVDIDGVALNGLRTSGAEFNGLWVFENGEIRYDRANSYRIRATIGKRDLRGSYDNFNAPSLSRTDVVWTCDGTTEQIIVR